MNVKLIDLLLLVDEREYVAIRCGDKTYVTKDSTPICPASWLEWLVKSISTNGSWDILIVVEEGGKDA